MAKRSAPQSEKDSRVSIFAVLNKPDEKTTAHLPTPDTSPEQRPITNIDEVPSAPNSQEPQYPSWRTASRPDFPLYDRIVPVWDNNFSGPVRDTLPLFSPGQNQPTPRPSSTSQSVATGNSIVDGVHQGVYSGPHPTTTSSSAAASKHRNRTVWSLANYEGPKFLKIMREVHARDREHYKAAEARRKAASEGLDKSLQDVNTRLDELAGLAAVVARAEPSEQGEKPSRKLKNSKSKVPKTRSVPESNQVDPQRESSATAAGRARPERTPTQEPARSPRVRTTKRRRNEDAGGTPEPTKRRRAEAQAKPKPENYTMVVDYCPPNIIQDRYLESAQAFVGSDADIKNPIDLSTDPLRKMLHPLEIQFARNHRLECNKYLTNKRLIFKAKVDYLINGRPFSKTHAQQAGIIDVNKSSKSWEFFNAAGWLEDEDFVLAVAMEYEARADAKAKKAAEEAAAAPANPAAAT